MSNTEEFQKNKIKSGFWKSSSDNLFWIQVQNETVFWLGMNKKTQQYNEGSNWCHVGYGTFQDNTILLNWSDMPIGNDCLSGNIIIQIINDSEMKVIKDSGNFGLSHWKWVSKRNHFLFTSF